jgi:Bacterial SH3 domain
VRYARALLLLPALALAQAIHAETLYVIEQLVVSVSSAPDTTGERVTSIHSGDPVEVLDRQGDEVHVRLANGAEGWVKKSYLSAEEPLQHRLNERATEVDKLKQDVARLQGQLAAAQAAPVAKSAPAPAPASVPNQTAGDPAVAGVPASDTHGAGDAAAADPLAREPSYFMTPPDGPARPVWHWALGTFVIALVLGFALGWYALDRRIRRKYGGLRIY